MPRVKLPEPGRTTATDGFEPTRTLKGNTISYAYDALDRVTQVSYPDGTFDALA
jgi:hypothetical protein